MRTITTHIVAATLLLGAVGQAQQKQEPTIPQEKGLSPDFLRSLSSTERAVYKGKDLTTIGMPCGGIAAGQLYVRGDGSLACWWIANNAYNTGYGIDHLTKFDTHAGPWEVCYRTFEPFSYIDQYFSITVNGETRKLNKSGFDAIEFVGEYPIAQIHYKDSDPLPISIQMDVYSPFIPQDLKRSATPATILSFTLRNNSDQAQEIQLTGVLQNMVMRDLRQYITGNNRNISWQGHKLSGVTYDFLPDKEELNMHPYQGNMSLVLLNQDSALIDADTSTAQLDTQAQQAMSKEGNDLKGSVASKVTLKAGETRTITFALTWYFPNRPMHYGDGGNWTKPVPTEGAIIGNMYANWYSSSQDVAQYLQEHLPTLREETYDFHTAWYRNSNLPYWLTHRILMPVANLATENSQWWATGKFWSWEGVGSCVGTCTHVWNYAQAQAYLFPELERNVRELTDLSSSFQGDGGILSRNGWVGAGIAIDGHAGTILKIYREHLNSHNKLFLARNWEKCKKAMEWLIAQDGNKDGLIEGTQHNTYDISFQGANTYVGALYLAALRAAEKMALIMQDRQSADLYRSIYLSGKDLTEKRLWNGQYFIQEVDLSKYPHHQYAQGCLSDQLFGQTWAHILQLGHLYQADMVQKSLQSIWKYNWTPDVGTHNKVYIPERTYARAGEAGLFNCTFPLSEHLDKNAVRYRNEVWTGIEYQVATNMIADGLIEEGLSIVRAIHDRYHPSKHNPWNEIECGDHYARALASYGVLLSLQNYHFNGPEGILQYAPRIQQDKFQSFFTGAECWGNISQQRTDKQQVNSINVKWGKLTLKQIRIPSFGKECDIFFFVNGKAVAVEKYVSDDGMLNLSVKTSTLKKNDTIEIIQENRAL